MESTALEVLRLLAFAANGVRWGYGAASEIVCGPAEEGATP
jgi:hypothetical protein